MREKGCSPKYSQSASSELFEPLHALGISPRHVGTICPLLLGIRTGQPLVGGP